MKHQSRNSSTSQRRSSPTEKLTKGRSKKTGLLPGSILYTGENKSDVRVHLISYSEHDFTEIDVSIDEVKLDSAKITWINIDGLSNPGIIEKAGKLFNLHPLIMEDIVTVGQRPKIEDMGEYSFIVLKMLYFANGEKKELVSEQVSFILGSNYLITFQEKEGDVFNVIRERLRTSKGRIRKLGADYLTYSLVDSVIDNYFNILESIGERIESLEDIMISSPTAESLVEMYGLKRQILFLTQSLWPLRGVVNSFGHSLQSDALRLYIRDLYDHIVQIIDTVEAYRSILSEMVEIYLSSISNKLNEVMKILTIISTIFMPLAFITGVYGMNFKHMPFLENQYGYPLIVGLMAFISILMLLYFRRKRWL